VGGIVDEDVDAAETVDRLLDDFSAVLGVLQVAGHQHGLPAFFLDEFLDLVRFFSLIEKGDQDVRAFACERDRDRAAYAAFAAGDDGLSSPSVCPSPCSWSRRDPDAAASRRLSQASAVGREGRLGIVGRHRALLIVDIQ
jgi:hypothetical protein